MQKLILFLEIQTFFLSKFLQYLFSILYKIDLKHETKFKYKIVIMKVLVFDTETTGLPSEKFASIYDSKSWPHIIQLSYILFETDNDQILTIENDYINLPENIVISKGSIDVHGIDRKKLNKLSTLTIQEALYKFINFVKECDLLVGHNVSFDKRMVLVECIRNKIQGNLKKTYCTMKEGKEICNIRIQDSCGETFIKSPKLIELYKHLFDSQPKNTHNAIIDVLLCLRCFVEMYLHKDITRTNRKIRTMIRNATS